MKGFAKFPWLWICAGGFLTLLGLAVVAREKLKRTCQDTYFISIFRVGLDCNTNDFLAVDCSNELIWAVSKSGESKFSLKNWARDLNVDPRFAEAYDKNSTYRFTLNEGTLYEGFENVEVLFFLSDGKMDFDWGGRGELWGYDDDFVKLESFDQVFKSKEAYTMIITSDLELKAMPVSKALKLRWNPSDPRSKAKITELRPWDDTKFNGGRTYESERD